jgi:hypothetical protein
MPLVQSKERIRGSDGKALHPTQKPEEMLKRIGFYLPQSSCRNFNIIFIFLYTNPLPLIFFSNISSCITA